MILPLTDGASDGASEGSALDLYDAVVGRRLATERGGLLLSLEGTSDGGVLEKEPGSML